MSGGDFQVGDLVERVSAGADPLPPAARANRVQSRTPKPPLGSIHRVAQVVIVGRYKEVGLVIPGWPSEHPTTAWHNLDYRKVEAADEQFTTDLRARLNNRVPA